MTRGLSQLQKQILAVVYEESVKDRGQRAEDSGAVSFNRRPQDGWYIKFGETLRTCYRGDCEMGTVVSRTGRKTPAHRVAVTKATARLEARGLVMRHWYMCGQSRTVIDLTDAGREAARYLLENTATANKVPERNLDSHSKANP
jgi:hypothetical protein